MHTAGIESEAQGGGGAEDGGVWAAKTVKRPPQQPAQPQFANFWAPLTRKRHIPPHPAQSQHTNYWALRTRKRHQQEHRPQRPTERSDPTQHAKGRMGDRPGPRKETTTRRTVTQGGCWDIALAVPALPPLPLKSPAPCTWYCIDDIGTASMQESVHRCSVCLHQRTVPHFALKYPCNPPRPQKGRHLATPPPPGDEYNTATIILVGVGLRTPEMTK